MIARYGTDQHGQALPMHVLPNHVHALIRQRDGGILAAIVQSWKTFTAKRIAGTGSLWQRDYWDTFIRDDQHFRRCVHYIHDNPVRARLVDRPEDWRWSSAHGGVDVHVDVR
jgi:putative transposase